MIFMISLAVPTLQAQAQTNARANPILLQAARETPEKTMSVIVQKTDTGDKAEQLVTSLGGTITEDLSIINAFAAEMTA
jgi:hypothetical protein